MYNLDCICKDDDLIIIHEGIRPMVDESVLTDVIKVAKEKGNAVTSLPDNEQIFVINHENSSTTQDDLELFKEYPKSQVKY